MPYVNIELNDILPEIDTKDLIEELETRKKNVEQSYSAKRNDASHAGLALIVTSMLGVALINGQAAVYMQMGIGILDGPYQTMFYAVTGTMLFLLVTGLVFSLVTMFRVYAGRVRDYQVVSAHALYWYFLAMTFLAVWFVLSFLQSLIFPHARRQRS